MNKFTKVEIKLLILILASSLIRGIIAGSIEFGNDEVYYWTYALFPDWSHFDHPPMIGWMIQLFSLNLIKDSEFFIRLASIIFGAINTGLIYLITKTIYNERAGLIASLLYTSSIYCFIIAGIFILPDTPQSLFWLLSIYLLINVVSNKNTYNIQKKYLLLAAVSLGFGMLSKYSTIFIWVGLGLYVLIYERKWLLTWQFYISILISLVLTIPIILWNIQHHFLSFTFHSERVNFIGSTLQPNYLFKELLGQIIYNNPIVFVLIILALISFFRKKIKIEKSQSKLILLIAFPLIFLFLLFAMFRSVFPHWTGPAYMTLLVFPAVYLSEKFPNKICSWPVKSALILLMSILVFGMIQINFGMFMFNESDSEKKKGYKDFSLEMFGWNQMKEKFEQILILDIQNGIVDNDIVLLSNKWFPAAHIDYYVARPLGIKLLCIGSLDQIHKYAWINQKRGGFKLGMSAYYITTSHFYKEPGILNEYFSETVLHNKFPIIRNGKVVEYVFIYLLKDLTQLPESVIIKDD